MCSICTGASKHCLMLSDISLARCPQWCSSRIIFQTSGLHDRWMCWANAARHGAGAGSRGVRGFLLETAASRPHRGSTPAGAQHLDREVWESGWHTRLGLADVGVLLKACFFFFFSCVVWMYQLLRLNDTLINNSCWQYWLLGANLRMPGWKPLVRLPWVKKLSSCSGAGVMQ